MIDDLRMDLKKVLKTNGIPPVDRYINYIVIYLIYLKYLCDTKKVDYEQIIHSKEFYNDFYLPDFIKYRFNEESAIDVNKLLRNIIDESIIDLVNSYLLFWKKNINFYPVNDKKVFYNTLNTGSHVGIVIDLTSYDINGNTTYILHNIKDNHFYDYYHVLDEILGNNNKYLEIDKIDFSEYKYFCIYDNMPRYLNNKYDDDIYQIIIKNINKVNEIILYTKYNKIGNFKEGRLVVRYLKNVIIKNNNAVLIFNKNANEVSIINYDNPKIVSFEKLQEIILNNRRQKDILVKASFDDIRKNNMRIGFNLYQMDKGKEEIDINKIVDDNTDLLRKLNHLNEEVEKEINNLFNL